MAALAADDAVAIKTAMERTASNRQEVLSHLQCKAKGGNSFYYDDLRVGPNDSVQFYPEPGDTILHMAVRYKRSTPFIAELLDLGADRTTTNNAGFTPVDLDPDAIRRADKCAIDEPVTDTFSFKVEGDRIDFVRKPQRN